MKQIYLCERVVLLLGLLVPFAYAGCGSSTMRNAAVRDAPAYTEYERTSNVMRLVLVKSLAEAEGSAKLFLPGSAGVRFARNRSLSQSPMWFFIMARSVCSPLFGGAISDWRYSEEGDVTSLRPWVVKRHASCVVHPAHRDPYQFQCVVTNVRGKREGSE